MPNGNVRAYRANTPDKAGVSELQITWEHNIAPTVTTTHGAGYVMQYEDEENHTRNINTQLYGTRKKTKD